MVGQRVQAPAHGHNPLEIMTQQDYSIQFQCSLAFRHQPELDEFEAEARVLAASGLCDGSCTHHSKFSKAVRVVAADGTDWGWFSYCETAQEENAKRGFSLYTDTPIGVNKVSPSRL